MITQLPKAKEERFLKFMKRIYPPPPYASQSATSGRICRALAITEAHFKETAHFIASLKTICLQNMEFFRERSHMKFFRQPQAFVIRLSPSILSGHSITNRMLKIQKNIVVEF